MTQAALDKTVREAANHPVLLAGKKIMGNVSTGVTIPCRGEMVKYMSEIKTTNFNGLKPFSNYKTLSLLISPP